MSTRRHLWSWMTQCSIAIQQDDGCLWDDRRQSSRCFRPYYRDVASFQLRYPTGKYRWTAKSVSRQRRHLNAFGKLSFTIKVSKYVNKYVKCRVYSETLFLGTENYVILWHWLKITASSRDCGFTSSSCILLPVDVDIVKKSYGWLQSFCRGAIQDHTTWRSSWRLVW